MLWSCVLLNSQKCLCCADLRLPGSESLGVEKLGEKLLHEWGPETGSLVSGEQ